MEEVVIRVDDNYGCVGRDRHFDLVDLVCNLSLVMCLREI